MKPIDLRDHNWKTLRDALTTCRSRRDVFLAIIQLRSCTTRTAAMLLEREVHTIRPRFSELEQHGLIHVVDYVTNDNGIREGVYQVRTPDEFSAWRDEQLRPESHQRQLI